MRLALLLVLVFITATIFAVSNSDQVTVMFLRWPIYTGPLSVALVGACFLGALLTFAAALVLQAGLRERLHELDQKVREQGDKLAGLPSWARPRASPGGAPGSSLKPPEDTRRFPEGHENG
ncbi:MAG TPA: LapA family protein [Candidatus Dormibacteraeota bacterium]|jgi:uncharacterized integral membrane protein|nr:LapA family protein [Candidatus Dormibacteraeota bacterium]